MMRDIDWCDPMREAEGHIVCSSLIAVDRMHRLHLYCVITWNWAGSLHIMRMCMVTFGTACWQRLHTMLAFGPLSCWAHNETDIVILFINTLHTNTETADLCINSDSAYSYIPWFLNPIVVCDDFCCCNSTKTFYIYVLIQDQILIYMPYRYALSSARCSTKFVFLRRVRWKEKWERKPMKPKRS